MQKYLIIGCGYIGERLADLLHGAGHEVTGVTHSADSAARLASSKPYTVLAADVSDANSLRHLADSLKASPDVIIHCASSSRGGAEMYRQVYLRGCGNLIAAFPGSQLLFTSSSSVYPQTDGSVVTEESDASPDRETSRLLRETEELVLSHEGCVARLAGIYGPSRWFVLKNYLEGTASIEGNNGQGRCLNQIHREDAASALLHLATARLRGVFNVVDDSPITQRECFERLSTRFHRPMPSVTEPDTGRKRAWTHKVVSNAKLRASGWSPLFPSCFDALTKDTELLPSILAQVAKSKDAKDMSPLPAASEHAPKHGMNIVLIGLMGSGKSTVARLAAQNLGFAYADTDHLITDTAGCSIPDIFAREGEAGFRQRETQALRSLLGTERLVIATGGGIVTQPDNIPLLKQLGYVVWLNATPDTLHSRTARSDDRPLLKQGDAAATLRKLYDERRPLYEAACDFKITTDDLAATEVAYGVSETARVHFCKE